MDLHVGPKLLQEASNCLGGLRMVPLLSFMASLRICSTLFRLSTSRMQRHVSTMCASSLEREITPLVSAACTRLVSSFHRYTYRRRHGSLSPCVGAVGTQLTRSKQVLKTPFVSGDNSPSGFLSIAHMCDSEVLSSPLFFYSNLLASQGACGLGSEIFACKGLCPTVCFLHKVFGSCLQSLAFISNESRILVLSFILLRPNPCNSPYLAGLVCCPGWTVKNQLFMSKPSTRNVQ